MRFIIYFESIHVNSDGINFEKLAKYIDKTVQEFVDDKSLEYLDYYGNQRGGMLDMHLRYNIRPDKNSSNEILPFVREELEEYLRKNLRETESCSFSAGKIKVIDKNM